MLPFADLEIISRKYLSDWEYWCNKLLEMKIIKDKNDSDHPLTNHYFNAHWLTEQVIESKMENLFGEAPIETVYPPGEDIEGAPF